MGDEGDWLEKNGPMNDFLAEWNAFHEARSSTIQRRIALRDIYLDALSLGCRVDRTGEASIDHHQVFLPERAWLVSYGG